MSCALFVVRCMLIAAVRSILRFAVMCCSLFAVCNMLAVYCLLYVV